MKENLNEKLRIASAKGNVDEVKKLLDAGADVNAKDANGRTPLIFACDGGNMATIEKLIEKGADVNVKDANGRTPLILACNKRESGMYIWEILFEDTSTTGDIDIVEKLLDKGAKVDEKDAHGETPLMHACWNGNIAIIKKLIEKGANVNEKNKSGDTILICACKRGYIDVVKELLEKGAKVNEGYANGMTPLMHACWNGNIAMVKELLEAGADVNKVDREGKTMLKYFKKGILSKINSSDKDKIEKLKECVAMLIKGGIDKEKISEKINKINSIDGEIKKYLLGEVSDIDIKENDASKDAGREGIDAGEDAEQKEENDASKDEEWRSIFTKLKKDMNKVFRNIVKVLKYIASIFWQKDKEFVQGRENEGSSYSDNVNSRENLEKNVQGSSKKVVPTKVNEGKQSKEYGGLG